MTHLMMTSKLLCTVHQFNSTKAMTCSDKFVLLSISLFCYRYLCFVIDIFVLLSISFFCYRYLCFVMTLMGHRRSKTDDATCYRGVEADSGPAYFVIL